MLYRQSRDGEKRESSVWWPEGADDAIRLAEYDHRHDYGAVISQSERPNARLGERVVMVIIVAVCKRNC